MQNLHNCHGCQKEKHHFGCPAHILEENVLRDIVFYCRTGSHCTVKEIHIIAFMLAHDEIGAVADIENPSHRTDENGHCRLIDIRNLLRCDENEADKQYGNND